MTYRVSSPHFMPKAIKANDAKSAAVVYCTHLSPIEVTVRGPEATTVWRASRHGAVLVRWRWNEPDVRLALKSNGLEPCDVDTWAHVLEGDE